MMQTREITGLQNVPPDLRGCVLTIGNFDGVHRGHQSILSAARQLAGPGGTVVAMTFEPPPERVLRPQDPPQRLTPHTVRVVLLAQAGADAVVTVPATRELLGLAPGEFVRRVILERFGPRAMVEGPTFFYGRKRGGTTATLQQAGAELGFDVRVVEPCVVELPAGPVRVSSTVIRGLLGEGDVAAAGELLGRPFALLGPVVHGEHLGRTLNFPTANLRPTEQIVPADGVYAGLARIGQSSWPAAISIGCKPTFDGSERYVEAYLLDAEGDFYGRELSLQFLRRLRDQQAYDSAEALIEQIQRDVRRTRQIAADPTSPAGDPPRV